MIKLLVWDFEFVFQGEILEVDHLVHEKFLYSEFFLTAPQPKICCMAANWVMRAQLHAGARKRDECLSCK